MNGKYVGQIVQFDSVKKFGFIRTVDTLPFAGDMVFVHQLNCIDTPFLGAFVQFNLGKPYKLGRPPQAVQVTFHVSAGLEALTKGIDLNAVEVSPEIGASKVGA